MRVARYRESQTGAIYVEAAVVLPILLLVTFASAFFFLLAARHFSLQMLANEIARDISLSLDPRAGVVNTGQTSCIQRTCAAFNTTAASKVDVSTMTTNRYDTPTGCWNDCARTQYLLATDPTGGKPALDINLTVYPAFQWYDTPTMTTPPPTVAAVGDYVLVELRYPAQAVLGGGIPFFGAIPNINLVGTAIAVIERPSQRSAND
jgi:Flp pilus assembly protein TadG